MDMANGLSQGQDANASLSGNSPVTPAEKPVQVAEERTFKQSEVNDIVKKAKHGAIEDFKRLQTEQPQYFQQKYGESVQQPLNNPNSVMPEDAIRKMAAEEAVKLRDQWVQEAQSKAQTDAAKRTVENFWNKVNPAKEKYQDFDQITGDIELARFPNVVQLLGDHIENSGDVLYELGKDRIKLSQLEQLAYMSPRDAIVQAKRLAKSLSDNEVAANTKMPNEPLNQMRPSNTGTGSNGALSVRDYRSKYKV